MTSEASHVKKKARFLILACRAKRVVKKKRNSLNEANHLYCVYERSFGDVFATGPTHLSPVPRVVVRRWVGGDFALDVSELVY